MNEEGPPMPTLNEVVPVAKLPGSGRLTPLIQAWRV